jgi:hypothetical protein
MHRDLQRHGQHAWANVHEQSRAGVPFWPLGGRHLCQLGHRLLLCPQLCGRVQLRWQLGAGFSVHNDKLAVCKWAEVQLCIGLLYVLHCMSKTYCVTYIALDAFMFKLPQLLSPGTIELSSPGMKMHVRVASDQSLKMLLHCFRVATSVPHATASELSVSTWLCSCRCLTNAD